MEYLDGGSLAQWLQAHPVRTARDVERVIDLFRAAGRGLAAAHAGGLVHRDFKPANVLLGRDGRLKVADFGLAREHASDANRSAEQADSGTATATGGTPAYMAPEHLAGRADARSDQFSFCVALWEALWGQRPFAHRSIVTRLARDAEDRERLVPIPPASGHKVPRAVIAALSRGLAVDAAGRWPSMDALIDALDLAPRRRRRRWIAGLAVGAAAVAGVLGSWRPWAAAPSPCARPGDELVGAWDQTARTRAQTGVLASGWSYAGETWARIEPSLDRYAEDWLALRDEACQAALVRHERSAESFDLTMACLDRRREELAALTRILARADANVVEHAVQAVGALSAIAGCREVSGRRADIELPADPVLRGEIEMLQRDLADAQGRQQMGLTQGLLEDAQALAGRATQLRRRGLWAEAKVLASHALEIDHRFADAEAALGEALQAAAEVGDDRMAANIWARLVLVVGAAQGDARAVQWRLAADAAVVRAGDDPRQRARLHHVLGAALYRVPDLEGAERELTLAIEMRRGFEPPEQLGIADGLSTLASVRSLAGRHQEATPLLEEALAIHESVLGRHHPAVINDRSQLGVFYGRVGRYQDAVAVLQVALTDAEDALGSDHPAVASILGSMGPYLSRNGDTPAGLDAIQRALSIMEARGVTDDPGYTSLLVNLAVLYDWSDRPLDALAANERVIATLQPTTAIERQWLGHALANAGSIRASLGDAEAGQRDLERAVTVMESALGEHSSELAGPLFLLGKVLRQRGQHAEAIASLQRAVSLRLEDPGPPHREVAMRLELAQARWDAGDRAGAVATATAAEPFAERAETAEPREDLDRWLADHRTP
jgi:eukaryotic-like serine/threonine-protein kinase